MTHMITLTHHSHSTARSIGTSTLSQSIPRNSSTYGIAKFLNAQHAAALAAREAKHGILVPATKLGSWKIRGPLHLSGVSLFIGFLKPCCKLGLSCSATCAHYLYIYTYILSLVRFRWRYCRPVLGKLRQQSLLVVNKHPCKHV